jgi:hypothetical protein
VRITVAVAALVAAVLGLAFARPAQHPTSLPPRTTDAHDRPQSGARPPQFVVVSFDGAGGTRMWTYWRAVARRAHAHFTFFVSGVYLVDWAHRDRYRPPRHALGTSAIGFAQERGDLTVAATAAQLARGFREGHEIGTHYNGHFCGPGGVSDWTAADWRTELDEFDALLEARRLPFDRAEVIGGRTPCLEGNLHALYRVLARRGLRYDASRIAPLGEWPTRIGGIWSVPLLELPLRGHTYRVVSMDYNFYANGLGERETFDALWNGFRASYRGNRAPFSVANHFETWNRRAYDHALTRFVELACRLPAVRCTTIRDLVDWLDLNRA